LAETMIMIDNLWKFYNHQSAQLLRTCR